MPLQICVIKNDITIYLFVVVSLEFYKNRTVPLLSCFPSISYFSVFFLLSPSSSLSRTRCFLKMRRWFLRKQVAFASWSNRGTKLVCSAEQAAMGSGLVVAATAAVSRDSNWFRFMESPMSISRWPRTASPGNPSRWTYKPSEIGSTMAHGWLEDEEGTEPSGGRVLASTT